MGPYDTDLRVRVVAAYERGEGSIEEIAALFGVGKNTVMNWLTLWRQTGSVAPRPHAGGVEATLQGEVLSALLALLEAHNDATLEQLHRALEARCGVQTSRAAVSRALLRAGVTRKKVPTRKRAGPARRGRGAQGVPSRPSGARCRRRSLRRPVRHQPGNDADLRPLAVQ